MSASVPDDETAVVEMFKDRWSGPEAIHRREFEGDPLKGLTRWQRLWGRFYFWRINRRNRRKQQRASKMTTRQIEAMDRREREAVQRQVKDSWNV